MQAFYDGLLIVHEDYKQDVVSRKEPLNVSRHDLWLDNVDMHTEYAKFDQNIPFGSRVLSIFTNC